MGKVLFLVIASLFLTGCMATPSPTQLSSANYGELPASYKEDIQNNISAELKDPFSASYKFGAPKKAYLQGGLVENFKMYYGWVVPVSVNAKNSYGAYTGFKTRQYMFIDGVMVDATLKFSSGYASAL
ncbi:hypothetical protein [Serratia fonticola]|uniref:Lipoprotein n=1 Tax=Serratia fonticola TaxID=47917 RepID=A0AAW3WV51_SERFO|nr:hypothetical protein [Serratia fonticola]ALX95248.1 hypothetical protein AV650_17545 [Serratia fonticola]MBC3213512.1 hypothetical protein [Serratia fonticola]MBP0996235.1 hypothetical protein [Serratia fonticola]MBP1001900.1 hypothetical protein [Serratia fonticola]MBP1011109.1 hypothetical protein [Serratia fonticola]